MAVQDSWNTGMTFQASDEDNVARAINGSGWLQPCHCSTTGSETFTISSGSVSQISGTTVDGVSPAVNDRILIKDAPAASGVGSAFSSQPGNGVYTVTNATTNLTVSRVYEMSATPTTPYVQAAAAVAVMAGTANAGLVFIVTTPSSLSGFTYGTNNIQFSPATPKAGTGLTLSGSTLSLSGTAQTDLALAATSLQAAGNVLALSGTTVQVASMATGQVIFGNAGTPTIGTVSGDVAIGATGVSAIQSGTVGLSKLANLAANSVIGNSTGSSATPTAIALATGATSSAIALRDANANITANSVIEGFTTTATAGATTTLTVSSTQTQQFTGTTTQICILPNATALANGQQYFITNRSTGAVTVEANGASTLQVLAAGSECLLTLASNATSAGTWDITYLIGTVSSASVVTANGFAGTVATATTTPAITIQTTVTGLLKGNGTAVSAAASGTDFAPATSGTAILKGNGSGGFSGAVSSTDYAPATSGSSALKGNGSGGFSNATLNDVGAPTSSFSMNSQTVTSLGTPVNSTDAATKAYVDTAVQGLNIKNSSVAATTGSETFSISLGSVTQITGTSIDGVSPNVNDYVLIKDAPAASGTGSAGSTQPGNGLYLVTSNTTNLSVSRATDMSGSVTPVGAFTFVAGGTANSSTGWVVSTPSTSGAFTYGTGNIKWTQFSLAGTITAGTGLVKSGSVISIENSGVLLVTHGGTGAATLTGLVKGNGTSAFTAATSGTDYAPATSGTSILKASSGGFANAVSGTDYAPATSGTSILTGNGLGGFGNAVSGVDYAPATSGTSALKANNLGGFANATLNDVGTPTASYSHGGFGITSMANPVNAQDAATKIYVDSSPYHPSCRVATTGTETFTIASGTVTQISGTTVDGISPSTGDRILIKDAPASTGSGSILSSQPGNGIYSVTGNITNLSVSRVTDMSSGGSAANPAGSAVIIEAGTANATTSWKVSSPSSAAAFTYGTTAIQWTPAINTGNVLIRSGNTISVASMATGTAILGNGGTPTISTIGGDVSVGATGTVTIGAGAVTLTKIASAAYNTTPTASTLAEWDANANLSANSFIDGFTTTATASATTTLTITSTQTQVFTGTQTQTVKLPTTSVVAGGQYLIVNNSTGAVTVQSSGANTITILAANTSATFTAVVATPTTAANWNSQYLGLITTSGKSLSVSSSMTLAGTDATTMTFPSTTGNVIASVTGVSTVTGTPSSTTYLRGDGTWSTPAGGGGGSGLSARVATVGSETFTITSGSVTQISGTTVDGVSPSVNDLILIKDAPASTGAGSAYSTQPGNGLYTVTANTTNLSVSRTTSMSGSNAPAGLTCFVEAGTLFAGTLLGVTSPSSAAAFTYGTTSMAWGKVGGGPGGGVGRYTTTIGNGSSTQITVTHNLNTSKLCWAIQDSTGLFVNADFQASGSWGGSASTTQATFNFQTAPASNAYTVTLIG